MWAFGSNRGVIEQCDMLNQSPHAGMWAFVSNQGVTWTVWHVTTATHSNLKVYEEWYLCLSWMLPSLKKEVYSLQITFVRLMCVDLCKVWISSKTAISFVQGHIILLRVMPLFKRCWNSLKCYCVVIMLVTGGSKHVLLTEANGLRIQKHCVQNFVMAFHG